VLEETDSFDPECEAAFEEIFSDGAARSSERAASGVEQPEIHPSSDVSMDVLPSLRPSASRSSPIHTDTEEIVTDESVGSRGINDNRGSDNGGSDNRGADNRGTSMISVSDIVSGPLETVLDPELDPLKDLRSALECILVEVNDAKNYPIHRVKKQLVELLGEGSLFTKSTARQRLFQTEIRKLGAYDDILDWLRRIIGNFYSTFAYERSRLSVQRQKALAAGSKSRRLAPVF
jgi:hypothetical protein